MAAMAFPRKITVLLIAGVLLLDTFVVGLASFGIVDSKQEHHARAAISTENISRLLEREVSSVFDRIDLTLSAVADEAERQLLEGSIRRADFDRFLRRRQDRLPEIISLRVTDEAGVVLYGEGVPQDSTIVLSDRDFFVKAKSAKNPGLIIGQPVLGRISKQWVIPVARRISRPHGTFAGMAYANIPAGYFVKMFSSLNLGQHGLVTLRNEDHVVMARHPELSEVTGEITPISDQFRALLATNPASVTYDAFSPTDGWERTYAYTKFQKFPLYVIVGAARDDYLDPWRRRSAQIVFALLMFIFVTCILAWLLLRAWRRGFSSDQALGESEERFRLLFKYSPIGLVLVSPDRRIFDANEAFCAMVGRGLEELKRCTFLDITHPDDRDENLVNVNGLLESRLLHYSAEKRYLHKAGHVVLAHVLATAIRNQAGKVLYGLAIVEDITEHREAERIRIERMEKQRDVLVREVHHRIKNNLQGVVNLLEQIKLKQPNAADALEEAAGQISAVAVVHGLQSRAQALEIRPRELVQAIVAAIVRISSVPIICSQNDDPSSREWRLNGRDAVAIALVVNELIYNAIKHTRPDKEAEVTINFESQPGAFSILVRNRPATLPANFDWESGAGFGTGLSLIAALLPPHGARLAFSQRNGGVEALLQLSHPCVDVPAALSH